MKLLRALLPLALLSGGAAAQGVLPGVNLGWLADERGVMVQTLGVTAARLGLALGLGLAAGTLLAALMRSSPRVEAWLTPWVLALLAVPWVLILVALNLIPTLGVRETTGIGVAALATAVQVFALGRRKLEERREAYLRRALWYGFLAVMAGELLARTDGLGAKIRFYALFTQFDHLAAYLLLAGLLWLAFALLGRVLLAVLGRSFLGRGA
ncbi:hypothetical protein E5F05_06025 [Deinococcus metallilatus]|uniref:ABC-type nitrate/sulfonate/bicarbonate transport system permease component n=1 Tax=Deinococcus metallilatus TaxID=1211322 RepID=A0AAJ5FA54_9DEIO|nr:hypothetical protein [Deinococcus metallilatus]MBB5294496.1 ABC-type nitrate/sulfonate/bicarbonate transport system permease component [Deinococcus metallilatus]QBY07547.1 hypothetical protein E5F05_06025 [Deinococcus metallilatus]RXJ13963.1 hypothetical protein ERJ73_04860 [Deinococcus metallilatus]TLK29928.1 hypothetical protein FCS05_05175 [Deinococcus metallilatus]GMA15711.1 hypothetical protein GCM10025871_20420 [Deinococcus metallilatus]